MLKKILVLSLFLVAGFFYGEAQLNAVFTADVTHGCGSLKVQFTDLSTGNPTGYSWNFGNGKTSVTPNPVVVYDRPGIYSVYLKISNSLNVDDTLRTAYIIIDSLPNARFNFNTAAGCVPLDVNFRDSGVANSGFINYRSWDFGDGNNSSQQYPLHTYTSTGIYTVSFIVGNSKGCFDTLIVPSAVTSGTKPAALFNAKPPLSSCASDPINFVNNSTGIITSYLWQFGDGDTTTRKGPLHFFTDTGYLDVTLIATYSGCSDTNAKHDYVYIKPPYVAIRSLLNCDSPYVRNFQMKFLGEKGFLWDFGDGTTDAVNKFPRHVYARTGTYLVKLMAFGTECSFTDSVFVNVIDEKPTLSYTTSRPDICKYDTTRFSAISYNPANIQLFEWDFGDGTKLSGFGGARVSSHVYNKAKTYYPLVITTDKNGCYDTSKPDVKLIVNGPTAQFTSNASVCMNYSNPFTDQSTGDGTHGLSKWIWDYGDGQTDSLTVSPFTHIYNRLDTFNVKMKVIDAIGCADSIIKNKVIFTVSKPVARFFSPDSVNCFKDSVHFIDQSAGQGLLYSWNFGDGIGSASTSPVHTYTAPGVYQVILTLDNNNGCANTAKQKIRVMALPHVDAGMDTFICAGKNIMLRASGALNYSWSANPSLSCLTCADPIASTFKNAKYYVTGTDSVGCAAMDSVLVKVIQPLKILVASALDTVCVGTPKQLIASGADIYTWSPANGLNNVAINNPVAKPSATTIYTVKGSDNNHCFTDSASVKMIVSQYPSFNIIDTAVTVPGGSDFLIRTTGSPDIIGWQWTPATDLSCANCPQPTARANKIIKYHTTATNNYGCSVSDNIIVRGLCDGAKIFIPNTFSPNGDHVNDMFYPRGNGLYLIKSMRIFNRIGQLVFQKLNFPADTESEGWDGTYNSRPATSGVYLYFVEIICNNGSTISFKGDVTIL